jgi:predicted phosphodiesterase
MRRLLIILTLLLFTPVYGETIEGVVTDFDLVVYDQVIINTDSKYPVFNYDGVIYVPLSRDSLSGLGLNLIFDDKLILTTDQASYKKSLFLDNTYKSGQKLSVFKPPFEVVVNGYNISQYYTLLMYKNIIYVPMIDSLVVDKLGWQYEYNQDLYINSQIKSSLNISRMIFSPGESINSVGLTFTLDNIFEDLSCNVNDDKYNFEVNRIEVPEHGTYNYSYKTTIKNLEPDKRYEVEISNQSFIARSSFKSLKADTTKMVFFGDIQGYKQTHYDKFGSYLISAKNLGAELTFIAGDVVDTGNRWQEWRYFDHVIDNELIITAIGNHDVIGSANIYEQSFNYPKNGLISERNFYIDLPYARVAVWDTESFSSYDEQGKWLSDIMKTDKFKIVLMHRSVYPMAYDESFVRNIHKYFDEALIDLVLSGHDHIYNRTTMKNNLLDDEGTTYIVGGSGSGSKYYTQIGNRAWEQVVYDDNSAVFVIIDINETHINVTAYKADDITQIIDSVQIERR